MTIKLFVPGKLTEFGFGLDLVYDGAHKAEGAAVLGVTGGGDEIHASLPKEFAGGVFLAGAGRVENRDCIASGGLYEFHGRDIRFSVSEVDHVVHGDAFVGVGPAFVDKFGVPGRKDALLYFVEVLGFAGVVYRDSGPFGLTFVVVDETAGKDVLELLGNGGALYDVRKAGLVDVVLDYDAVGLSVGVYVLEPVTDALVELDVRAVFLEAFVSEFDAVSFGFVVHQFHVGEDVGGVLALCNAVAFGPEFRGRLADGLDEPELLHVAGRQSAVEVVDKGYDGFSSHIGCKYSKNSLSL